LMVVFCSIGYAIKDKALILYFSFDSAKGNTVPDMSGGGHDGTLSNAKIIKNPKKIGSGALQVENQNGGMTVESFKELETYQDNTFVFWLYYTAGSNGAWSQIIAKLGPADRSPGIWQNPGGTGIHYRYNPGNAGFGRIGPNGENSDFPLNEWYHIAGVKEGGTLKFYVNGVQKGSVAVPAKHDQGSANLCVGKSPTYRAATFIIDDLGVYNRALTEKEVNQDMDNGVMAKAVSTEGKLAITWASIKE